MKKTCTIVGCLALLLAAGISSADDQKQADKNYLASLERFVGGQWVIHGKWSSGEELQARSVYEWGLNKKILKAQTYVMNGDKEYQRYEGIMAWHPKKKCLYEVSFSFTGDMSEIKIEEKDADTLLLGWSPLSEGEESKVRQIIKFKDKDNFVWTVSVQMAGEWKQIMEGTWTRAALAK